MSPLATFSRIAWPVGCMLLAGTITTLAIAWLPLDSQSNSSPVARSYFFPPECATNQSTNGYVREVAPSRFSESIHWSPATISKPHPEFGQFVHFPGTCFVHSVQASEVSWPVEGLLVALEIHNRGFESVESDSATVSMSGWPARCFRSVRVWKCEAGDFESTGELNLSTPNWLANTPYNTPLRLPISPIWSGILINITTFSAAWATLTLVPFAVRRSLRKKHFQCQKCGYDMRGGGSLCPECGLATPMTTAK
jgi:hypothetical protein